MLKQRNKPKEPPKAPEKAPFFLPSLPGVEQRFNVGDDGKTTAKEQTNPKSSHRGIPGNLQSEFQRRLLDEDASGDCESPMIDFGAREAYASGVTRREFLFVHEDTLASSSRP